uniref:RNA helicase n=1 Tax=Sus scrofa TaxID=9823 RepID=A0A480Y2Q9_PIG
MALARQLRLLSLVTRLHLAPRRDLTVRGPDEPLPVVRIPRALQRRQEQRQRGQQGPPRPVLVRPGQLLISARRPELNQPARLTLGRWEPAPLASRGWKNRRARQDHFSIERKQQEAPALRNLSSKDSFADLGLEPRVLSALQEAAPEVVRPTTVQSSTIPPLLGGRHILCAAETGSGKTLGYMLPLLQRLLGQPSLDSCRIPAPRGLVLVPSRELAEQVRAVAQPLGSSLGLQVRELGGGHGMSRIRLQLSKQPPADVLVATPGALWKGLKSQLISLEQLSFLVLDEADTLLDESFLELTTSWRRAT